MARVVIKIKRQDDPMDLPYWEIFEPAPFPGMTLIDALRAIAREPATLEGNPTSPVVWDCSCEEGLCGACTMLVNGKVRQACSVLVEEFDGPVTLEPLSKFPVVRDLRVDRNAMWSSLLDHECWIETDGLSAAAPACGIRISKAEAEAAAFMDCVMCGACSEACPQVNPRSAFSGAFLFSRVLPLNRHSLGREQAGERLSALSGRGGVADCSGAENCERVCPRGIPLVKASALLSWDASVHSLRSFLRG